MSTAGSTLKARICTCFSAGLPRQLSIYLGNESVVKPYDIVVSGTRHLPILLNTLIPSKACSNDAVVNSSRRLAAPRSFAKCKSAIVPMHAALLKGQLTEKGLEIVAGTSAEFKALQAREYARWKALIETRRISVD